jgi:hypothetical protein
MKNEFGQHLNNNKTTRDVRDVLFSFFWQCFHALN